jgi:hypothetical protein
VTKAEEVLHLVQAQFSLRNSRSNGIREATYVAGTALDGGRLVVLFTWMNKKEIFGYTIVIDEYAGYFEPNDPTSLASAIVSNDLAGPPGRGSTLNVNWAAGLVLNPSEVRWIGSGADESSR